jgi:hypothetical protein
VIPLIAAHSELSADDLTRAVSNAVEEAEVGWFGPLECSLPFRPVAEGLRVLGQ